MKSSLKVSLRSSLHGDLHIGVLVLRYQLVLMLLWVVFVSLSRPHLFTLIKGYSKFSAVASEQTWGWVALTIAFGLAFLPEGSLLRILWKFGASSFFALLAILVSAVSGINYGTGVYAILSVSAGLLAYVTFTQFLDKVTWANRLPPERECDGD